MATPTEQKHSKLTAGDSSASKSLMFPADLLDVGNDLTCITFFINTIQNGKATINFNGGLITPKNTLKSAYGETPVIHSVSTGLQGSNSGAFNNTFTRSDQSITLPMPKNLNFSNRARWASTKLGAAALEVDQGTDFSKAMEGDTAALGKQLGLNLVGSLASKYSKGAIKGKELVELGTSSIMNDYAETLFSGMETRSFNWTWTLTPRNTKEAIAIDNILRMFRFHQLPEFRENIGNGNAFLLYPSSFDIVFWREGQPNKAIPRVSTCALVSMDTNYTPNGGYINTVNGTPQSYTLSMTFAELSIMHKGLVGSDLGSNVNATGPGTSGTGTTF